jgi:hypothetical protein
VIPDAQMRLFCARCIGAIDLATFSPDADGWLKGRSACCPAEALAACGAGSSSKRLRKTRKKAKFFILRAQVSLFLTFDGFQLLLRRVFMDLFEFLRTFWTRSTAIALKSPHLWATDPSCRLHDKTLLRKRLRQEDVAQTDQVVGKYLQAKYTVDIFFASQLEGDEPAL